MEMVQSLQEMQSQFQNCEAEGFPNFFLKLTLTYIIRSHSSI